LEKSLNVDREILFLPSVSDATKHALLKETIALLYTPVNEHFGITPLESMVAGRPVIACDSGGPCETIVHGVTGLLVSGSPEVSREIGGTFKF
jgi:alpha-1,3/alpha-1,6-mannosyltransferase